MVPPILCYHNIDARFVLGATRVGPRVFRKQMSALVAAGFRAIGAAELLAMLAGESSPSPAAPTTGHGPLLVTFDDGYESLHRHAFPVLADLGLRALVFVITDYVGRENAWDVGYGAPPLKHLDWDQLAYWQERGIEVHAHGSSHARLTTMSDAQLQDDLSRSREAIERRLGKSPLAISYPFGIVDSRVMRAARSAGFQLGFGGPSHDGSDPMALGRLAVYPWDPFAIPAVMQAGPLGALARWGARTANRISVVTPWLREQRAERGQ